MSVWESLQQLHARYAWAFDFDELEQIGDCFTSAATVEFSSGLAIEGRDAAVAELERRREVFRARRVAPWHVASNLLILESAPEEVAATCFFTFFTKAAAAAPEIEAIGYYDDRFVREDGCWRIARRRIVSGGHI